MKVREPRRTRAPGPRRNAGRGASRHRRTAEMELAGFRRRGEDADPLPMTNPTRQGAGLRIETPDLGGRRGRLSDWITQRWVQHTGRRVRWSDSPWLAGPVGDVAGIGPDFFERFAVRQGLKVSRCDAQRGLLERFADLEGPCCRVAGVHPEIARFYERTSAYGLEVWSEWCGAYRPFGQLLAMIFSRRLQQLNMPLSPLDSRFGVRSEVLRLEDAAG